MIADLDDRSTRSSSTSMRGDWSLARAQPGKVILGSLGGIESGIRQLIRQPLETVTVGVDGRPLVVPTIQEILRIKAWLAVTRNQTRDYLDIAALADRTGVTDAAADLVRIDDYDADINRRPAGVSTQVVRQLADPRPRDEPTVRQLAHYRGLDPRWHDWAAVRGVLAAVAEEMLS